MNLSEIKEKYPYLYETHMHTSEGSACGQSEGVQMARKYKENGYAGVIVTDHNWGGNTAVDRSLPWNEWLDKFFLGYEHVKEEGDRIGLQVFQGYEAGYGGPEFLIYGITTEGLKAHPELRGASMEDQLRIIHEMGGMVIEAHPFREAWYIKEVRIFPEFADGIEIINASHSNPKDKARDKVIFDEKATALAKERNMPATAGSDQHSVDYSFGGGVAFPTPLKDIQDYIHRIMNREDYVLTNGRQWFTKEGDLLLTIEE